MTTWDTSGLGDLAAGRPGKMEIATRRDADGAEVFTGKMEIVTCGF